MTGDKLKRVQSVRKWLEKAEQSFTSHRDISGELNLIMAQAEMERLKETDRAFRRRKLWGSRLLALAAAAALFSGYAYWQEFRQAPAPPAAAERRTEVRPPVREAVPAASPAAVSGPMAEASAAPPVPAAGQDDMAGRRQEDAAAAAVPAETPRLAEPAAAEMPVLSEWEIQRVVGEAGRTLRGQS